MFCELVAEGHLSLVTSAVGEINISKPFSRISEGF